jgi:acyl carrier protein phosphodiesterase
MERENWLMRYATVEGTQRSLSGMSKRITHGNNLDKVMPLYESLTGEFDALALTFLNEIVATLHHERRS